MVKQVIEKKYYKVDSKETLKLLFQHIQDSDILAYDTETTTLNPRKGKIIGFSVSGEEGIGFYLPDYLSVHRQYVQAIYP